MLVASPKRGRAALSGPALVFANLATRHVVEPADRTAVGPIALLSIHRVCAQALVAGRPVAPLSFGDTSLGSDRTCPARRHVRVSPGRSADRRRGGPAGAPLSRNSRTHAPVPCFGCSAGKTVPRPAMRGLRGARRRRRIAALSQLCMARVAPGVRPVARPCATLAAGRRFPARARGAFFGRASCLQGRCYRSRPTRNRARPACRGSTPTRSSSRPDYGRRR